MPYPHLFSRLLLGRLALKNRIAHTATVTNFARENRITEKHLAYYGARARGGAGMIITEGMIVHPTSVAQPAVISLTEADNADGLKRLAETVEPHDCRLLGQLWHVGRQQLWSPVVSPWGVSSQPDALSWSVPHVMNDAEIREVIEGYAQGARVLRAAGFSGAELHGAHGYLITQFLSPWSNTREDGWGGDREGRTRFVREILSAIRGECGEGFLLGLKMPAEEGVPGGIDLPEARRITQRLAETGQLDYVAFSQGNFSLSLENHVPDMHWERGPFLHLPRAIKATVSGVAVMAMGKIVSADHAEQVLAEGGGDLIGLSRALVADAALPAKATRGESATTRPCIFCNTCWGEIHAGKPIACVVNPGLGNAQEDGSAPPPVKKRRRVVVIGAGLTGLAAAGSVAARGHQVVLVGRSGEVGGKARLESRLPGRAEMALAVDYLKRQAAAGGVAFRLGAPADAESVRALAPDAVVLATGAWMRPPALDAESEPMHDLRAIAEASLEDPHVSEGTAVVLDQDQTPAFYAAVELLARRYRRVVLITPRVQIARAVSHVSAIGVYRRLYGLGVEMVLAAVPVSLRQRRLVWRHAFTGRLAMIEEVALACYATPRVADDRLAGPLGELGVPMYLAGDCYAPRGPMAAIHDGLALGGRI